MKGRAWESNSLKGEERKTSRREAYDEATALLGTTAAAKISASIKAIMQIVGTAKSSSKKNEQAEYVETIQMAFETTLMGEIVSRSDQIWEVYSDNVKNRESAFVQERVMLTVLQNTLKPGTPAKTKYRLAKRKDVLDVRAMYVAVRDANQLSTSKLTTRMLRRKIRKCSFDKGANYDEFVDTMEELFEGFEDLEDETTGESLALKEGEKVDHIVDKLIQSDPSWQDILDSALTAFDQGKNEFTLEDLHARVHTRLDLADATGQNEKGKAYAQNGKGTKCYQCGQYGHIMNDCPQRERRPVCRFFASKGKCRFGDKCKFSHDDGSNSTSGKGMEQEFREFMKMFAEFKGKGEQKEEEREEKGKQNKAVDKNGWPTEEGKAAKQTAYWPVEEEPHPWEAK